MVIDVGMSFENAQGRGRPRQDNGERKTTEVNDARERSFLE